MAYMDMVTSRFLAPMRAAKDLSLVMGFPDSGTSEIT